MEHKDIKLPEMPDATMAGWLFTVDQMAEYARASVRFNAPSAPAQPERRPFDLEAAKRGEAIQTRDGRKARFVAFVPEASEGHRVLAIIEGEENARSFFESGYYYRAPRVDPTDLSMASKPKRTVWQNVYQHDNEAEARANAKGGEFCGLVATAVPIEIDA